MPSLNTNPVAITNIFIGFSMLTSEMAYLTTISDEIQKTEICSGVGGVSALNLISLKNVSQSELGLFTFPPPAPSSSTSPSLFLMVTNFRHAWISVQISYTRVQFTCMIRKSIAVLYK